MVIRIFWGESSFYESPRNTAEQAPGPLVKCLSRSAAADREGVSQAAPQLLVKYLKILRVGFQRLSGYKIILEVQLDDSPFPMGVGACPVRRGARREFYKLKPSGSLETPKVKKRPRTYGAFKTYRINNNSRYFTNGQLSSSTSNSSLSTA